MALEHRPTVQEMPHESVYVQEMNIPYSRKYLQGICWV